MLVEPAACEVPAEPVADVVPAVLLAEDAVLVAPAVVAALAKLTLPGLVTCYMCVATSAPAIPAAHFVVLFLLENPQFLDCFLFALQVYYFCFHDNNFDFFPFFIIRNSLGVKLNFGPRAAIDTSLSGA